MQPNVLGNVPYSILEAAKDYSIAMPKNYKDFEYINQINLGIEGRVFLQKFNGYKKEMHDEIPDKASMIEALLETHELLFENLPRWNLFTSKEKEDPELSNLDIDVLEETLFDIEDRWRNIPDKVDTKIPEALRSYKKLIKHGIDAIKPALYAISDIVNSVVEYVNDISLGALNEAKPGLKKSISIIFQSAVVGSILTLAVQIPWWGSIVTRGIEFLKLHGLL